MLVRSEFRSGKSGEGGVCVGSLAELGISEVPDAEITN